MTKRETSDAINDVAAEWVVRTDHGALSPDEQAQLDAWLAADARHLGAYARALAVFAQAQRAKALGQQFDPAAFAATDESLVPTGAAEATRARLSRRALVGLAGSAAVAIGTVAIFGSGRQAVARSYRSARGEIRKISLADGSSVTLNTASKISVLFDDGRRDVSLLEGEAFFSIEHDSDRPFVVCAGPARVLAIGTSFSVQHLPERPVQVMVREGFVNIGRTPSAAGPVIRASANSRVIVSADGAMQALTLSPAELARQLSWREGLLSFEDTPLKEAANEFARYSDTRIEIDFAIASETVTGLFAVNKPLGFARAAAEGLDLKAEPTPEGIRLRQKG